MESDYVQPNDVRLTESGEARNELAATRDAYRVARLRMALRRAFE